MAGHSLAYFLHGRLGLGYRVGLERRLQFRVDGGAWYGAIEDHVGNEPVTTRRLLWPMAGLSFLHEL